MPEKYYDAREGEDRFRVQYPHISGDYAVLDWEKGSLVAVGYEEHALGMAEALNGAVSPEVDEAELVAVLQNVNRAHQWRVMEYLTHLVREKIKEGFEPRIDTSSIDALEDSSAAHLVTEALVVAIYPRDVYTPLAALGIHVAESPNDELKKVADEQKWRVSLALAKLFRQSLIE